MSRYFSVLVALGILLATAPAAGQVVETTPSPPRTDESVTVFFNADEGTGGLEGHDGEVYAHTGISTDQSGEGNWKCVKNHWPTNPDFTGNRDDTRLTQVEPNRYKLEIQDIRAYYQKTSTSCNLGSDEEILTMNLVFRNADGTKEGKGEGGSDIFVDVIDVSGSDPVVEASITQPTGNPPLYPFMVSTDTTVTVSIAADTANVDSLSALRLFVDGTEVASSTSDSLGYALDLNTPNRFQIQAVVEAKDGSDTLTDTSSTVLIRTPDVVDQSRPSGVEDGINYNNDGSVTLSLYAPNKDFVYALGDFSNWEIDGDYFMKRHQAGPDSTHWWITLDNLSPGQKYAYQYFVDGELRIGDPFSHKVLSPQDQYLNPQALGFEDGIKPYPGDETENLVSVFEPGQSEFDFSAFQPPAQKDLVIYELLLRDFLENNSYATLTDTLDYLDRLGVNAIELMPVSNFGGNVSWGYNPNFHLALDKAYGPPEDLKQFVEEAHSRGIAVLLDVVYNHVTGQSPLVQLYGAKDSNPFLNVPPSTPFSVFNQLDHGSPFIKNYLDRANEYWLEEFNVDGFRYDLAKGFVDRGGSSGDRIDNLQRMADFVWDEVDADTYVILELFASESEEKTLTSYRADQTGGMMVWHNMNRPYSESSMGYINGESFPEDLTNTYFKNRGFTEPNLVTYMESHDEQWLMRRNKQFGNSSDKGYSTKDLRTALERQKLVGAFFFLVPGPRMMWQFGELGYGYGPDECLKPGDGSSGECVPSDPGRTAPKPIRWGYRDSTQSPERVQLYEAWQALLRLRNQNEVFTTIPAGDDPEESIEMKVGSGEKGRWIKLENASMDVVVVGNFGVTRRTVQVAFPQTGTWYNFFEDAALQVDNATQSFPLRPGEFRIYTTNQLEAPPAGLVPSAPIHRSTQENISSDGTVDFGATGVDVTFSGVSGSCDVTVEKVDESPLGTDGINEENVSRYRFVLEAGSGLNFEDGTELRLDVSTLDGIDNPNNVIIYQRPTEDAGSFTALNTSYTSTENELVASISSANTLGEFVLASDSDPLPVELADFNAQVNDDAVRLTWQTAAETNNTEFRVQRSVGERENGGEGAWTQIGRVEGAGTTTDAQSYRFTDGDLPFEADRLAYRLAQVDADGSVHHSEEVTVQRGVSTVTLRGTYPNPARRQVTVQYALPTSQTTTLRLYDVLGRRVKTVTQGKREGRHEVQLDVSGLTSGVYFLRLTADGTTRTQRLTVVR